MITQRLRVGSKVRVIGTHRYGEVGYIDDMSVQLNGRQIYTVYVSIRLPIPNSKFYESALFDIDEVERVDVADVIARQLKVAA